MTERDFSGGWLTHQLVNAYAQRLSQRARGQQVRVAPFSLRAVNRRDCYAGAAR